MANHFGPVERAVLHFHIRRSVAVGDLPPIALQAFRDNNWRQMLEESSSGMYDAAIAATTTVNPSGGHPFLQWLIANLPAILSLIIKLLPLFTGGTVGAAHPDHVALAAVEEKLGFALPTFPPGTGALILQLVEAIIAAIQKHNQTTTTPAGA